MDIIKAILLIEEIADYLVDVSKSYTPSNQRGKLTVTYTNRQVLSKEEMLYVSEREKRVTAFIKANWYKLDILLPLDRAIEDALLKIEAQKELKVPAYPQFLCKKKEAKLFFMRLHILRAKKDNGTTTRKLSTEKQSSNSPKISAKYYALYHWIKVEMGSATQFEFDENGQYPKSVIMDYAKERYKQCSSEQFYREYIKIDITDKKSLPAYYGPNYKKLLISLSDDDKTLKEYLIKFPD